MEYTLEIKQIVDYPRCRIYREFVQTLIADRSIRTGGSSGLFYFTVLCSYANFRTSYRRLDGITYTVYPGEWVCRLTEVTEWFRVRFQHQALSILSSLQEKHLINYTRLGRGNLIKFSILGWRRHNTVLDYNCPCQKETGFFFLPVETATELIGSGKASEMDIVLDIWVSAIYKDSQVMGSDLGPVAYFRNGTGSPLISYSDLAQRWGISRSSVARILKKLSALDYLSLMSFPGRNGSVIYLNSYLSTMFQISDILVDKSEVAMALNLKVPVPDDVENEPLDDPQICVPDEASSVPKTHMAHIVRRILKLLGAQGVSCFECPKAKYMLYPLSDDCQGVFRRRNATKFRMEISCGGFLSVYHFELEIVSISREGGACYYGTEEND